MPKILPLVHPSERVGYRSPPCRHLEESSLYIQLNGDEPEGKLTTRRDYMPSLGYDTDDGFRLPTIAHIYMLCSLVDGSTMFTCPYK